MIAEIRQGNWYRGIHVSTNEVVWYPSDRCRAREFVTMFLGVENLDGYSDAELVGGDGNYLKVLMGFGVYDEDFDCWRVFETYQDCLDWCAVYL